MCRLPSGDIHLFIKDFNWRIKIKYAIITYDGSPASIAAQLLREGNVVLYAQVENPKDLGVDSGLSQEETPEAKKRRLSIYDGILHKMKVNDLLSYLSKVKDEEKDDWFFIVDFNSLFKVAQKVHKMGFNKGMFPTEDDFNREKDRNASKEFVKKNYTKLKVAETHKFNKIDDGIAFLRENKGQFALKSDGNFVDTVVPLTDNDDFAREELIFQLKKNQSGYEKGYTLEQKIKNPIEVAPQLIFWDGEVIASTIDIETRMIGSSETGFQTGGNENAVFQTSLKDPINKLAFPPAVYEIAKNRKGMFIFDCGILFDEKGDAYFTEFAGNRWGWGGVFSELSMARTESRCASEYFEAIASGKNPFKYAYGTTLSIYNLLPDKDETGLYRDGIPFQWDPKINHVFFPYQVRKEKVETGEDETMEMTLQVGSTYTCGLLAYTTGYGNTFDEAVDTLYKNFDSNVYCGSMYYRPKLDFKTTTYTAALKNRINYLLQKGLISGKIDKPNEDKAIVESYVRAISKSIKY